MGLSMENILGAEEIENLFSPLEENNDTSQTEKEEKESEDTTTEELDIDSIFTGEASEGVGSAGDQGGEDISDRKEAETSPNKHFYSSIAKALKEEGVFPELDDNDVEGIEDPETFVKALEKQMRSSLDEKQRRIDEALNSNVPVDTIRQYEATLDYLDKITESDLEEDSEKGEQLRKQLIYQDLINKKYSEKEALEELDEIMSNGSDIRKAKRALSSNIDHFNDEYQKLVDKGKAEEREREEERKKQAEDLRKSIFDDNEVFGELKLDKTTRQKVYDNVSKPIYKDKESGVLYTALQKYQRDNPLDFVKNVGLLFTLTDGFKNLDGLVKPKVKKEVGKGLRELENTLNNTSRTSDGNLKFVSGTKDDPESALGAWDLDI